MSNSREKNQPPPPNLLANNSQVISDRVPVRPLQGLSDPVPSVRPVQRVPPFGEGVFRPHIKPPQQENAQGPENTAQPAEITAKVTGPKNRPKGAAEQQSRTHRESDTESRKENDGSGAWPLPDSVDPANPAPESTKGAADAAPFQHSMPTDRPKDQRLENWNDRRAFALPYFFRSTTRLSRVRKPAALSAPRRPGS